MWILGACPSNGHGGCGRSLCRDPSTMGAIAFRLSSRPRLTRPMFATAPHYSDGLLGRGFTLLEVVVSMALLTIAVASVLQIFSGGFKNIHRIEMAHRAMAHGENVMSELLADGDLTDPSSLAEELDEDFRYVAQVEDWEPPSDQLTLDITEDRIRLLQIQVRVYFKHDRFGKYYQLTTLKAVSNLEPLDSGIPGGDAIRQLFGGVRQ